MKKSLPLFALVFAFAIACKKDEPAPMPEPAVEQAAPETMPAGEAAPAAPMPGK